MNEQGLSIDELDFIEPPKAMSVSQKVPYIPDDGRPTGRVLKILQHPDPRLYVRCAEVEDVHAPEVAQAIADLRATAATLKRGGGLAAPQIGISLRIVFMDKKELGHEVVINPVFVPKASAGVFASSKEACYSVSGADLMVDVKNRRHREGRLFGVLPDGRKIKKHVRGFTAVMAQHEIDHLDGRTIAWDIVENSVVARTKL